MNYLVLVAQKHIAVDGPGDCSHKVHEKVGFDYLGLDWKDTLDLLRFFDGWSQFRIMNSAASPPPGRIYFAAIANGMGDLIVCLPALQWLISTSVPVVLVLRSPEQAGLAGRIEGLAGTIEEVDFDEGSLGDDEVYINMRAHPLQADHIWGSAEFESKYPGYKIIDVLKGIGADWRIGADYDELVPLPHKTVAACCDKILLIPGSAGRVKCWPTQHWFSLAKELEKDGLDCLVLGQPEKCDIVAELTGVAASGGATPVLPHFPTPTLADALDAISSARLVVAVDTGLMHMALHQGIATVALFRSNTMFLRPGFHCRNLVAPQCDPACLKQEFSAVPNRMLNYKKGNESYAYWKTWDCALPNPAERCMSRIHVAEVYGAVRELLF